MWNCTYGVVSVETEIVFVGLVWVETEIFSVGVGRTDGGRYDRRRVVEFILELVDYGVIQ